MLAVGWILITLQVVFAVVGLTFVFLSFSLQEKAGRGATSTLFLGGLALIFLALVQKAATSFPTHTWITGVAAFALFLLNLFMILLILIQRGKGGGLAGAFGGMGGSSAFGSRAGDTFTYFTITCGVCWIFLIMFLDVRLQPPPVVVDPNPTVEAQGEEPEK